jgi:hypothetical protein
MPHFQLVKVDGEVLGARELGRPDWPPGSVIYMRCQPWQKDIDASAYA